MLLEEYVTGAVLDALESPRVQEALRDADTDPAAPRRAELLAEIKRARTCAPMRAATWPAG